jgi:hypothetical protein
MSLFALLTHALLYVLSFAAVVVLLASALALGLWMLLKLRRLVVRLLGGTLRE